MKTHNRPVRLTLFSTAMFTAVLFVMQLFLFVNTVWDVLIALPVTALVCYVLSRIVVDRIDNSLREDIERHKRFVSDASHELATPITVINGHADMLLRRGAQDAQLLARGLAIIKDEALRMNELVENLLLLARSDSGKQEYKFGIHNISTLLEEIIAETRIIAPDFEITAELAPNLMVKCDEASIRRVVRILFSNAVKYSSDTRAIHVHSYSAYRFVSVVVRDSGTGIPAAHLPRIFDRFYRVDAARPGGGSGLGLSIAKEIITAHRGELSAESEAGKGAEFMFTLPS